MSRRLCKCLYQFVIRLPGSAPHSDMNPKTSVVVPTYNRSRMIDRCVKSVLEQTHYDYELLVVDDGSTDNTRSVVSGFDDDRIRYYYQENQGANAARNTGVNRSNGEYISFLDSDDVFHENHLEIVSSVLDSEPSTCAGVATSYRECRPNGDPRSINQTPNGRITLDQLRHNNTIGSFTAATFRASVFDHVGMLDTSMPATQDYEFFLRVLKQYEYVRGSDDVLADRIESANQISSDIQRKKAGYGKLEQKHGDTISNKRIAAQHYSLGFEYGNQGHIREARARFRKAIKHHPYEPLYYYHFLSTLLGSVGYHAGINMKKRVNRLLYN